MFRFDADRESIGWSFRKRQARKLFQLWSRPVTKRAMPITRFVNGQNLDPDTTRVIGLALEMVCVAEPSLPP